MHTMQSGCDNLWIHQNKYNPVLSLMKNDNYSHTVLTDSYKQVTSGECPEFFNNYIQPQHSIASCDQNVHCRVTGTQCMWLPSIHSLPFNSYASNFHTPEALPSHSNNLGYISKNSQVQQNHGLTYMNNPKVNIPQLCSNQSNSCNNSGIHSNVVLKKCENVNQQIPRIRVRDIFSLKNNSLLNTLSDEHTYEHQSDQRNECALNCSTGYYNTISNSESLTEFSVPKNIESPINHHWPSYYNNVTEQPISYNQQNAQFYCRNQFQLSDKNLSLDTSKTNTSIPLNKTFINSRNIQKLKDQNTVRDSSDTQLLNNKIKLLHNQNSVSKTKSKVNNNTNYGADVNERSKCDGELIKNVSISPNKHQEHFSQRNNGSLVNCNSSNDFTDVTSKIRNLSDQTDEENLVNHYSQSSVISFENTTGFKGNSMLNLPCLLENEKLNEIKSHQISTKGNRVMDLSFGKDDLVDNQTSAVPSYACSSSQNFCPSRSNSNSDCTHGSQISLSSHKFYQKEPSIDLNSSLNLQDLNSDKTTENLSSEICHKDVSEAAEAILQTDFDVTALKVKQENRNEFPMIGLDENISKPVIKTEENLECLAIEKHKADVQDLEKQSDLEKVFFPTTQNIKVVNSAYMDVMKVEKSDPEPENSANLKSSEKITQEVDNLKNTSNSKQKENKIKMKRRETDSSQKKRYKSKINRNKLEMLKQFLKNDEESDKILTCMKEKDSSFCLSSQKNDNTNEDKTEFGTNHSRRKLRKTCVVKNKNNKREMISLISNKIPRVDVLKNSPKSPETTVNSDESKATFEEETSKSRCVPEKLLRFNNLLPVVQNNEILKIGIKQENNSVQEEKDITNTMRAFQKLQTHFCMSCDLVSPIESFWINVVSGELRCLHCFKKMTLKTDASNFNSVITYDNTTEAGVSQNVKNEKDAIKRNVEKFLMEELLKDVQNKPEEKIVPKEESVSINKTGNLKKKDPTGIEQSNNEFVSDEITNNDHKIMIKSEKSIRKCVFEEKNFLEHSKHTKKDSLGYTRSRRDSKDEFYFHKIIIARDHSKKEEKQTGKLLDKSVKKRKESSPKEIETTKKRLKQETSEKSKLLKTSKESSSFRKQAEEYKGLPQLCSASESKSKGLRLEKSVKTESNDQLRKRKSSPEDIAIHKVFIVENHIKKEAKPVIHSSKKRQTTTATKTYCSEYKALGEGKQNSNSFSDRFKKSSSSTEEERKQITSTSGKIKTREIDYQNVELSMPAKQKPKDSTDKTRKSKEKCTNEKTVYSKEQSNKVIKSTKKHRNRISLREDKGSFTEVRKHFFEKIPKISKNDKRDKVVTSSEKCKQSQKPETTIRLTKEKLNLKVSITPAEKSEQKEPHERKKIQSKNIFEDKTEQKTDKIVEIMETEKKEIEDKSEKNRMLAEYKRPSESGHVEDKKVKEIAARKKEKVDLKKYRGNHTGSRRPVQFIEFLEKNKKIVVELVE